MSPLSWGEGCLGKLADKDSSCIWKGELVVVVVGQRKGGTSRSRVCLPKNPNHRVRDLQKSEQNWDGGNRKSYRMKRLCAKEFNFSQRQ